MKIYLLRHGTPERVDDKRRYIGVTDLELSQTGANEAEIAGKWLKENSVGNPPCGANISRVYSSPLKRAAETAKIVAETAGLSTPITAPELREINLGDWENRVIDDIKAQEPELFNERGAHPWNFRISGGETFAEAAERFFNFFKNLASPLGEVLTKSTKGSGGDAEGRRDILIVSHAGVMRAFLTKLMGWPVDDVMKIRMPMASLSVLEFDEATGNYKAVRVGFLSEETLIDDKIIALYKKYNTPERVINHMRAVADCAGEILNALSEKKSLSLEEVKPSPTYGHLPQRERQEKSPPSGEMSAKLTERAEVFHAERIIKAALLHDILRLEKHHAEKAAKALRDEGYDEIAALVGSHNDWEFDVNAPLSDADILWYADKITREDKRVSLEERFAASLKNCNTPEAVKFHELRRLKALGIRKKLRNLGLLDLGVKI